MVRADGTAPPQVVPKTTVPLLYDALSLFMESRVGFEPTQTLVPTEVAAPPLKPLEYLLISQWCAVKDLSL